MKRLIVAVGMVFTSIAAAFVGAPRAEATVVTVSAQGTVSTNSNDSRAADGSYVFGGNGIIAGKSFTLVMTIDDSGSVPPDFPMPGASGSTHIRNMQAVLTINGVSIMLGNHLSTEGAASKQLYNGGGTLAINFASTETNAGVNIIDSVGLSASVDNPAFAANADWRTPFSSSTPQTASATFFYSTIAGANIHAAVGSLLVNSLVLTAGGGSSPSTQIAPQAGFWWNTAESGTGYALDYKNGVLVVAVYSYVPGGAAQWYLASGPVVNNAFSATLDKYVNGQCISCVTYPGRPALAGNDGTIAITFTSATTGNMTLPGGRSFPIVPLAF